MDIIKQEIEILKKLQKEILKKYPNSVFIHTEMASSYATYIRFWNLDTSDVIEWYLANGEVYERIV